jgi:hypothetical protein
MLGHRSKDLKKYCSPTMNVESDLVMSMRIHKTNADVLLPRYRANDILLLWFRICRVRLTFITALKLARISHRYPLLPTLFEGIPNYRG